MLKAWNQAQIFGLQQFSHLVKDKKKLESLKDGLTEVQGQMLLTPLTLLLMIDLVNANNEIPSSVTLLYNKFFDLALGSEDKARKNLDILFNPEIKKGFLEELAFKEFFNKNRDRINKTEFDGFLDSYAKQQQWDADELKHFALEIERAGILEIKDYVNFTHATFLDYFIALNIYENREDIDNLNDYLSKLYFDEWWYDVVFYYAGLKKKIQKSLITKLVNYDDGHMDDIGKSVSKVLVGRLLQAAWQTDGDNKTYGMQKSLENCDKVREAFLEFTKKRYGNMPTIYSDFYVLLICQTAYGSRHLLNQSRSLINRFLEESNQEATHKAIQLLWANKDKFSAEEKENIVNKLFDATIKAPRNSDLDETVYSKNLIFLKVLLSGEGSTFKAIEKRLTRQYKIRPAVFGRLLPEQKKDFEEKNRP